VPALVVPSAKDGLHCGGLSSRTCYSPATVVPSAKDGLHCGVWYVGCTPAAVDRSSRPPRTGSIAARLSAACAQPSDPVVPSAKDGLHCGGCGDGGHEGGEAGRPVRQGRAPLRLDPGAGCGLDQLGRPVRQGRAPLRPRRGPPADPRVRRRPVRQGRAPLRPERVIGDRRAAGGSSRPPRTGSIAAATRWAWPRSSSRSSRPPRTGSIAAPTRKELARYR